MAGTIQQALTAAIPEAAERVSLARRINAPEELLALDIAALRALLVEHEIEIVALDGRIDANPEAEWAPRSSAAPGSRASP